MGLFRTVDDIRFVTSTLPQLAMHYPLLSRLLRLLVSQWPLLRIVLFIKYLVLLFAWNRVQSIPAIILRRMNERSDVLL